MHSFKYLHQRKVKFTLFCKNNLILLNKNKFKKLNTSTKRHLYPRNIKILFEFSNEWIDHEAFTNENIKNSYLLTISIIF